MKPDSSEATIGKAPQRKKWAKPVMRVVNIKELTKGGPGRIGDGDAGSTKRS